MKWQLKGIPILAVSLFLAACGGQPPTESPAQSEQPDTTMEAPDAAAETPDAAPEADPYSELGEHTKLNPLAIGDYNIRAIHIGDVALGHFNLYIEGGEPAAVRAWVGDENADGVVVTLAEFEVDHHCAHIEVPTPLPADAKLWVEIESPDGERLKGNTEL